ncbi:MAG: RNA polymerase sigma factor [Candidatus Thorarchaeota archaeon]|nr:MAG: RNA polymerase sigma factor [Candidatus Thorarchaeota archaeon]
MAESSDEVLIAAHREGETTAFAELVRRYGDALLGYLNRISANRDDAEDLFQETFRRVHENASSYSGKGKFRSWLYAIATNVARDGLRKARRQGTMISLNQPNEDCSQGGCGDADLAVAEERVADPHRALALQEQKAQVRNAIDRLPERQRNTLILTYYQGLSYNEAAETLNCSLGTVKSQMYRAVRTLARYLPETAGEMI